MTVTIAPSLFAPTRTVFLGAHAVALALAVLLVGLPVADRFTDRRAAMSQDAEDLQRLDLVRRQSRALAARVAGRGEVFLPAEDERVGSADLQALLQSAAGAANVTFLSVQGRPARSSGGIRLVGAQLMVEGSQAAVAALLQDLEGRLPLLRVTGASLRNVETGPAEARLRAELQVEAALRPAGWSPPAPAAQPLAPSPREGSPS